MLQSVSKGLWIVGFLSLLVFAGLSGGLRLIIVEHEDEGLESSTRADSKLANADYLELDPVRKFLVFFSNEKQ